MADYWGHWLAIGERKGAVLPRIYMVNWFRKSPGGDFLWPGYGENSRVLEWVFERCEGTAKAVETPIGNLPERDSLDVAGLDVDAEDMDELLRVDIRGWLAEATGIREYYGEFGAEATGIREYYGEFGDHVPAALREELDALEQRLEAASS
jgi:phosphoenolpyruvate carboxykinase (GTP)